MCSRVPIEFILFAASLLGIALVNRHTFPLISIGPHLWHEGVILANFLGLPLGSANTKVIQLLGVAVTVVK